MAVIVNINLDESNYFVCLMRYFLGIDAIIMRHVFVINQEEKNKRLQAKGCLKLIEELKTLKIRQFGVTRVLTKIDSLLKNIEFFKVALLRLDINDEKEALTHRELVLFFTYKKAPIVIQRAWRLKQYKKLEKTLYNSVSAENLYELNCYIQKKGVTAAPSLPFPGNTLIPLKAQEWVAAHPAHLTALASLVAKHTTYIPFSKFENRLRVVIKNFNRQLMQLDPANQNYIVLVNCSSGSNAWVLSLSLKYLVKAPVAVVECHTDTYSPISQLYFKRAIQMNPNTQVVLYLDDAIYSGIQINSTLNCLMKPLWGLENPIELAMLLSSRKCKVFVGVPYIQYASSTYLKIKKINSWREGHCSTFFERAGKNSLDITILPHVPMLLLADKITSKAERDIYDSTHKQVRNYLAILNKPFTFFAHKIADNVSTPSCLREGTTLNGAFEKKIPFIHRVLEPYKK